MVTNIDFDVQIGKIDTRIAELKSQKSLLLERKREAKNKEILDIIRQANVTTDDLKLLLKNRLIDEEKEPNSAAEENRSSEQTNGKDNKDTEKEKTDNEK